jgi:hypothetical protein
MRYLRRHANAFAQGGVWVDGFANVHRVCAHLNCQRDLADHVARVGADHAAAQDLAVPPASMAAFWSCLRRIVEQQFGHAFVAAIGNGAA